MARNSVCCSTLLLAATLCCICLCGISGLRTCGKFEACGVVQFTYPPATEPTPLNSTNGTAFEGDIGSGEGSGGGLMDWIPPLYDEFLTKPDNVQPAENAIYSSADYNQLCECAGDNTCPNAEDFEERANQTARLDGFLTVTYCAPTSEQFRHRCGRRSVVRVIGTHDEPTVMDPVLTHTLTTYNRITQFCLCIGDMYRKEPRIENWGEGLVALLYKCIAH